MGGGSEGRVISLVGGAEDTSNKAVFRVSEVRPQHSRLFGGRKSCSHTGTSVHKALRDDHVTSPYNFTPDPLSAQPMWVQSVCSMWFVRVGTNRRIFSDTFSCANTWIALGHSDTHGPRNTHYPLFILTSPMKQHGHHSLS